MVKNTALCGVGNMDEKKNEEKTNQENINQENQEENSYEFLKETIKAKPVDTKKLAQYVGKLLLSGAVLGLTAAVVFACSAAYDKQNDREEK